MPHWPWLSLLRGAHHCILVILIINPKSLLKISKQHGTVLLELQDAGKVLLLEEMIVHLDLAVCFEVILLPVEIEFLHTVTRKAFQGSTHRKMRCSGKIYWDRYRRLPPRFPYLISYHPTVVEVQSGLHQAQKKSQSLEVVLVVRFGLVTIPIELV